jgi:hypothetical protein
MGRGLQKLASGSHTQAMETPTLLPQFFFLGFNFLCCILGISIFLVSIVVYPHCILCFGYP